VAPPDNQGRVYLVGAGPGDPGLITWRGIQCLQQADLVLYDYLASAALLRFARADAERICLGRHGRTEMWSQPQIHQRLIDAARQGKVVVRLQGGDPGLFGRLAEETEALDHAGVEYQVVPGITAALAGPAYAAIALTDRRTASAVAFLTGQEGPAKSDPALDYQALARFPGTLVVYMGVTSAPTWVEALLAAGKAPDTPVAIIRRATCATQQVIRCRLDEVPQRVSPDKGPALRPPALFVCGDVARARDGRSWFERLPLFGRTILVTRPEGQADRLADALSRLGAQVWIQPGIRIEPPATWEMVDQAIEQISSYDWLVFSSVNGVHGLLGRMLALGRDMRHLGGVKLAAIGSQTAAALREFHLQADRIPDQYRAEALAAALADQSPGSRFLLARASRGRDVLPEELRKRGSQVDQVVVYESRDVEQLDSDVQRALEAGEIDWVTITSSAIARSMVRLIGPSMAHLHLASISPVTSQTLNALGYRPSCEASRYTMEGLVDAIVQWETTGEANNGMPAEDHAPKG
jgi:uroporphyrinogen III methyltransferase/synthase